VPGWLLDELATAGYENLDAGHVSRYDSKENSDAGRELSLLIELGLSSESVVVEFVQAGFLTFEHRGRPADFVYSRLALHHLPDFWKASALVGIHDILRHGGLLRLVDVAYSFAPREAAARIEAWCETADPSGGDVWARVELEEHVRDEHSPYTWLLEPMLERAGFAVEDAEYSDDGILAKYVARRA
jgi:SAM-dependent methyltransferase